MGDPANGGELFGFTPAWFALGIVDDTVLSRLRAEWDRGEDDNPEHYRYRVFREFLATRGPLAPELAAALFALGAVDPDRSMGGSMMADIVRRHECPPEVLDAAVASGRKHLVRIVERLRTRPDSGQPEPPRGA